MNNQNQCLDTCMLQRIFLSLVLLLSSLAAHAQTVIEAVSGSIQGGTEVVRIDLSRPLVALPTGFAIQSPARIALDFPGVTNAMGRSTVEVNQGNLKSISVVQAGERTRVVLNLKQPSSYKTEIQGNSLLIALEGSPSTSTPAAAPPIRARYLLSIAMVPASRIALPTSFTRITSGSKKKEA